MKYLKTLEVYTKTYDEESLDQFTFIPNKLIPYFKNKLKGGYYDYVINDFIHRIIVFNNVVEFYCEYCITDNEHGATTYVNSKQKHKGKVRSIGFGNDDDRIYLSLSLNRIKYRHQVDTDKSMTVYGNFDKYSKQIIDEINLLYNINKYNL